MLHIYVKNNTPRVEYIFTFLLEELLGLRITFSSNLEEFSNIESPKISYHNGSITGEPFFYPANLLFEESLTENLHIEIKHHRSIPYFFEVNKGALGFDVFAASFYLLARYEEYIYPNHVDEHGRFLATQSIAYKNDFLTKPIIQYWAQWIKEKLTECFPSLSFKKHSFQPHLTIDVDALFAYSNKPFTKKIGSLTKTFLNPKQNTSSQLKAYQNKEEDPFNNFSYFQALNTRFTVPLIFFIHTGNKSKYDPGFYSNQQSKEAIRQMESFAQMGLHPSYNSLKKLDTLQKEKQVLESLSQIEIDKSRQHYLIIHWPRSYQNLIQTGIKHDYSMGYTTHLGFRASIAHPFPFFDLVHNRPSHLIIHPFCIMDLVLERNQLTSASTFAIIDEVKKVNGHLDILWHSDLFALQSEKTTWKSYLEDILTYVYK